MMLADLRFRLRALFQRRAMERELEEELRFHLEREIEKYVRAGASRDEAERRARVAFGGLERIKDDARDARGISMIDAITQDLRYAWRGLMSKPGFTAAVVITLALGIGANTAMFGIVDRMLFRPPAYLVSADATHRVFVSYTWDGRERTERNVAYTRFTDLRDNTTSFDRMAAFGARTLAVGTGDDAREMNVAVNSAAFFDFFDARPVLGRFFTPAEDRTPAGAMVAVLGHGFWQSRYGGRADAIGQSLHIGSQIYTIVGVAPEGFTGLENRSPPVAFVPITAYASYRGTSYYQTYNWQWAEVLVHRKPGVSVETANADLTQAFGRSWDAEIAQGGGRRNPSASEVRARGEATPVLVARGPDADANARVVAWVMGVAVIVLLIACANVANLLLARSLSRRREIALRLALGVSRARLYQQLLTESLLIAALGGVAGLAMAQFGGRALRALFLSADDASAVVTDSRTLVFAVVVTLAVAVLTGLAPAAHALRADLANALKAGARPAAYRRSRTRTSLLLVQSALSVVLLVGAGLFVRSLVNVRAMRMGYDVEPVVYLQANDRGTSLTDSEQNALVERLVSAARATPGVRSVSPASSVPFYSFEGRGVPIVAGRDSLGQLGRFNLQIGNHAYFETMGTRIVRGRGIEDTDRASSQPVVVISEAMARAIWPERDAIGQQMRFPGENMPTLTVVGIAEDMRAERLEGDPEFWFYLPLEQYKQTYGPAPPQLLVRVSGRAEDYVEILRRRLQQELPGAAYMKAMPLEQIVSPRQRSWKFGATMFVALGGLALVLAAIGLYSVIAYSVAQRTQELGVRIALGASVRNVIGMVVGQGIAFAVAGIALGSVLALWAGRWVEPLLFRQSPRDPLIYGIVAAILLVVAILATVRPALRAMRVDPTEALRAD